VSQLTANGRARSFILMKKYDRWCIAQSFRLYENDTNAPTELLYYASDGAVPPIAALCKRRRMPGHRKSVSENSNIFSAPCA